MKRAANILGIVLLIALVAPFVVFAVPEVVSADESFVVLTPSMTPAIAPGDVVIVAERDPATVVEGDVITFMRGASDVPVTHRVIGVVETGDGLAFETMGDANEGPDPGLVPAANLVGVVALTIPYIGYVIQFAGTQAGFVALVLIPFGLLAATEVWSIVRGRDESAAAAGAADLADADAETASESASTAQSNGAADASGSGGVSVDAVGGAAAVLLGFAPYAAYVAFEFRTAASIAVAIGATTLLVGAVAIWVPASGVLDRKAPTGDSRAESAVASAPLPDEAAAPADGAGEGD
jgi:signal peptidase